uniref:Uncharacterized protein n=1 Tax=Vitis vinifera TaxID=29760 RepID=F6HT03_VITVI
MAKCYSCDLGQACFKYEDRWATISARSWTE